MTFSLAHPGIHHGLVVGVVGTTVGALNTTRQYTVVLPSRRMRPGVNSISDLSRSETSVRIAASWRLLAETGREIHLDQPTVVLEFIKEQLLHFQSALPIQIDIRLARELEPALCQALARLPRAR